MVTCRTTTLKTCPLITVAGKSTVKRPANFEPTPDGIGMKVIPPALAANRIDRRSSATMRRVEISRQIEEKRIGETAGKSIVAVEPTGVLPR